MSDSDTTATSNLDLSEYRLWLIDEWDFAESTADQYVSAARNLEQYATGLNASLDTYREWLEWLIENNYRPSTVNEYHTKAARYLDFIEAEFNPERARKVLPDHDPEALPEPLTREQVRAMRKACEHFEELAVLVLLYHTALRNSELRQLTWADVRRKKRDLVVERKKKDGWARDTLPLYDDQLKVIDLLQEARTDDNPYLFPARADAKGIGGGKRPIADEGHCSGGHIAGIVHDLAERGGVERHVWPHLFRHTRLTHMLEDGRSVSEVNQWADHAKMETTLRYARLTGEAKRDITGADSSAIFEEDT